MNTEKIVDNKNLSASKKKELEKLGLKIRKYPVSGYSYVQGTEEQFAKALEGNLFLRSLQTTISKPDGSVTTVTPKKNIPKETGGAFIKFFASKFTKNSVLLLAKSEMPKSWLSLYQADMVICPIDFDPAAEVLKIITRAKDSDKLSLIEVSNDDKYEIVKVKKDVWKRICTDYKVWGTVNKLTVAKGKCIYAWETKEKVRPPSWFMVKQDKADERLAQVLEYPWVKHDAGRYFSDPEIEKSNQDYADNQDVANMVNKNKNRTESNISRLNLSFTHLIEHFGV
jgi:hypothetical protein